MQGVTCTPGGQLPEHLYRLFTADKKNVFIKVTLEHVYLFTMFYYEHVLICLHFVYIVSNRLIFYCNLLR
jgi:hypothetical protein